MKLKFNKEGLQGEELKAVENLEKNITIEGEMSAEQVKAVVAEQIKEAGLSKETLATITKELDNDNPESVKAALKAVEKRLDDYVAENKKVKEGKLKSFNDILSETIKERIEDIRKASRVTGKTELGALKAVGDMSIAANFPGSTPWLQDVRNTIIPEPYNRVWLRDILLQGTTDQRSVLYPKENGGEGGADVWDSTSGDDKAQMDFDLTPYSAFVKWIAGYVIVDREMLDDLSWFDSYLRAKMLISLKTAENRFILNGTTDANPVTGLLAAATQYTATPGLADNPVNRILDAAWGQIPANTEDFYNPTNIILHPRDAVRIGLNQATGSGQYDLPAGSVGFSNGKLNIGGLDVVRTTIETQNNFLALDRNAAMFITKMAPELAVFVDSTLAKVNKVMLRIEERATLAIFNNDAIVTGTLSPATT